MPSADQIFFIAVTTTATSAVARAAVAFQSASAAIVGASTSAIMNNPSSAYGEIATTNTQHYTTLYGQQLQHDSKVFTPAAGTTTSTATGAGAGIMTTTTTTATAALTAVATAAAKSSSTSSETLANISGSLLEQLTKTLTAATSSTSIMDTTTSTNNCPTSSNGTQLYDSIFGLKFALPHWEALCTVLLLSVIIVLTIVGNILVILSVFTYKPLRIVQNFFIVSLAVADLMVALLVLPFNVAYAIQGRWLFGAAMCKIWLTCDILCCTSSILNLCAIALDRYWAITDPINYAQKRTVGRVLLLISGVWILSLLISSPPLLGWNDWPDVFTSETACALTTRRGYVIYSSLGSFFIPLVIMTIVYVEIFVATRRRLRERAKANKLNTIALKHSEAEAAMSGGDGVGNNSGLGKGHAITSYCAKLICCGRDTSNFAAPMIQNDQESISSETHVNNEAGAGIADASHHGEHRVTVVVTQIKKSRRAKIKDSIKHGKGRGRKQQTAAATKSCDGQRRESNNDLKHTNDKSSAEQLLPTTAAPKVDVAEVSTESGSDPKAGCIQVCVGTENGEDENASLKITPPVSSAGAVSSMTTVPLQKKSSGVYQFIEEKQKISLSKERRAARTLGIIMGVFVFCWLPFFLMYVILPFCDTCCPSEKFKNFITWLGYINSGLNPVIYTIFNLDYRRAFKRLLGIK